MTAQLELPLDAVVADDANQPRLDNLDEDHMDQLALAVEQWPPITVASDGARYFLVDGFHRVETAKRLGLTHITATTIPMPGDGDLASLGFDLNAKHGRPLSLQDRRNQAVRLLRKDPRQSDRSLSQRCGIAASTVATIRRELEEGAQIEHPVDRLGSDGKAYSVPERQPGELPGKSLGEVLGDGVSLFSSQERREMREVVRYLQRLKTPLLDAQDLPAWESPEAAARACIATLGRERAIELARELDPPLTELIAFIDAMDSVKA